MTYLELYYKLEKQGKLDYRAGLCLTMAESGIDCAYGEVRNWFSSNDSEDENYVLDYYGGPVGEWTDLRKNMLLLLAAVHGEL